jgi:hypothetical protein
MVAHLRSAHLRGAVGTARPSNKDLLTPLRCEIPRGVSEYALSVFLRKEPFQTQELVSHCKFKQSCASCRWKSHINVIFKMLTVT